jgi:serine/threonine protein kinase
VVRLGRQIALGLAAAHERGLIHRDIKRRNFWLEAQGKGRSPRVKILDFGLARSTSSDDENSLTRTGMVLGTPQFMSPEQARGDPVDQRADLFSLGSVLYALCSGVRPFRGPSPQVILARITDEEPAPLKELNPAIPRWLINLITSLLEKKPQDRIQTAVEVAELLARRLPELIAPQPDHLTTEQPPPRKPARTGIAHPRRATAIGRGPTNADEPANARKTPRVEHPPKPKGSWIQEQKIPGGCTLIWRLPFSGYRGDIYALASLCILGAASYQSFLASWRATWPYLLPALPIYTIMRFVQYARPARPESITLGKDHFRHDLGRARGGWGNWDALRFHEIDSRPLWRRIFGLPLVVEISKDELGPIEVIGDSIHYEACADRIEIGRYLRVPEQKWLAKVIQAWQGSD